MSNVVNDRAGIQDATGRADVNVTAPDSICIEVRVSYEMAAKKVVGVLLLHEQEIRLLYLARSRLNREIDLQIERRSGDQLDLPLSTVVGFKAEDLIADVLKRAREI